MHARMSLRIKTFIAVIYENYLNVCALRTAYFIKNAPFNKKYRLTFGINEILIHTNNFTSF